MLIGEGQIGEDKDHFARAARALSDIGVFSRHGDGVSGIDWRIVLVLIAAIQTYTATKDNV